MLFLLFGGVLYGVLLQMDANGLDVVSENVSSNFKDFFEHTHLLVSILERF